MARVRKPRGKAITLTELLGLDKTGFGTVRGPQGVAQSKQQQFLKKQAGDLDTPISVQPSLTNNLGQQIQTTVDQSLEN